MCIALYLLGLLLCEKSIVLYYSFSLVGNILDIFFNSSHSSQFVFYFKQFFSFISFAIAFSLHLSVYLSLVLHFVTYFIFCSDIRIRFTSCFMHMRKFYLLECVIIIGMWNCKIELILFYQRLREPIDCFITVINRTK